MIPGGCCVHYETVEYLRLQQSNLRTLMTVQALKPKQESVKGQQPVKAGSLKGVQAQAKSKVDDKKTVAEVWFYTVTSFACCV